LAKMLAMCLLTALIVMTRRRAMAALVRPSAISASTSRSLTVSSASGVRRDLRARILGDHLGIHRGTAIGHPPHCLDELADVADPVLEQVADLARAIREQLARIKLLH
jgi:hypothetical protein